MRAAFGDKKSLTVASQASKANWENMSLTESTPSVDAWHVMSYDYSVSDLTDANLTAGNAPLYAPNDYPGKSASWSINYTVSGYIEAGVPREKIHVGIPFYGHTWYTPDATSASDWQKFGVHAKHEGKCCGPFKATMGAAPGEGSG